MKVFQSRTTMLPLVKFIAFTKHIHLVNFIEYYIVWYTYYDIHMKYITPENLCKDRVCKISAGFLPGGVSVGSCRIVWNPTVSSTFFLEHSSDSSKSPHFRRWNSETELLWPKHDFGRVRWLNYCKWFPRFINYARIRYYRAIIQKADGGSFANGSDSELPNNSLSRLSLVLGL